MNDTLQENYKSAAGVITTAALVSIFIYAFVVALSGTLINEVVNAFSLEGADEGLMGSLTSLGFMLSLFFVIMIQGRAQKIYILIAAFTLQSIMLFVCGVSPTFFLFCAGCVLLGFSGGFVDTCCNSAIVDVRKSESTRYLGYLHGLFGVGSLLTPLLFMWLLRRTDWRGIHYILAAATMLAVLFIYLMVRGRGGKESGPVIREHIFTRADLFEYLRVRRNVVLALSGFFSTLTLTSVMVWIVRYMTLRFGDAELGALAFSAYWMCATVNRFFLAQFIKRAPMKFFVLGAALSGASLLIGILSGNAVILCVMVGVLGFCSGHFMPVLVSECAVGYDGRTTFTTSFLMIVLGVSRIVAPIMMAFLSTHISMVFCMLLPVAAALVASCCGLLVVKTRSTGIV